MISATMNYFSELADRFGRNWNTFWFKPSDPFALCVMRILSGLIALYVIGSYSFDLLVFFGPQGILTVEVVDQLTDGGAVRFSLLNYFRTPFELYAVHTISMIVLVLFTLGLWTRVTSVLAWLIVLSYVQRAPILIAQVEQVLVFVLFYLCLGPCGKALSLDQWLANRKENSGQTQTRFFSATLSTRLIQVHLCLVYLMMGISKLAGVEGVNELTWWRGDAVWWMAVRPDTPLLDVSGLLAGHSYLINAWTHLIVLFELTFAVFIWNPLARPLLLGISVIMWLSLAVITGLLPFALLMLTANLAFFPPDFLRARLNSPLPAAA